MKKLSFTRLHLFSKAISFALVSCFLLGLALACPGASAETSLLSPADLYEQNVASTVEVTAIGDAKSGKGYTYQTTGSGFVIAGEGYILTNYHLISDSKIVRVATCDHEIYDAEVVGYDVHNDFAVIRIDAENLMPVTLGNSSTLRVGEPVYTIGTILEGDSFSMTNGIICNANREANIDYTSTNLIETTCAIGSGSMGAGLFNASGEVIGIINAGYASGSSNEILSVFSLAIPVNTVRRNIKNIIEDGVIVRPSIGISISPLSEETQRILKIKNGIVIQDVSSDSPANAAGLKKNDVVISVDDIPVYTSTDFVRIISESDPGDIRVFHIYRQGQESTLDVEIGSKTESARKEEQAPEESPAPIQSTDPALDSQAMEDFFKFYFGY